MGESGVGKTNIILALRDYSFKAKYEPTLAVSYSSKEVSIDKFNKTIIFNVWDAAGKETYKSIVKSFFQVYRCLYSGLWHNK